jgi:hypothetical protein
MKEQHKKESPVLSLLGMGGGGTGTALGGLTLPKTYVDDVFGTYLYKGTGSSQSINNGIDLAGEGGLTWVKCRTATENNILVDTERGVSGYALISNSDAGPYASSNLVTAFNSNGFTVGANGTTGSNNQDYTSWTFRKQKGFFDCVTWSGDSNAGRQIAHNLGSVPGMIIIKCPEANRDWIVHHRSLGFTQYLRLNSGGGGISIGGRISAADASTFTPGSDSDTNQTGKTYVAYVFAHDDQSFGTDGDESIIKCGSYTGSSSNSYSQEINVGFEPQWLMVKANGSGSWNVVDTMRGFEGQGASSPPDSRSLLFNSTSNENDIISLGNGAKIKVTSTGFKFESESNIQFNENGGTYVYMAIRRPNKPPELATEVFAIDTHTGSIPNYISGFPVDFVIDKDNINSGNDFLVGSRLLGSRLLKTNSSEASINGGSTKSFDFMNGIYSNTGSANSAAYAWMFKRAPGFMDVVAYTGKSNTAGLNVTHNLGVVPELVFFKRRDGSKDWFGYSSVTGTGKILYLNTDLAAVSDSSFIPTTPTSTELTVNSYSDIFNQDSTYMAYLFATLPGISKVGSYSGTGNAINVPCGFTNGARFVLIKRTDGSGNVGDWYVWDSVRGIVSGNDPYILLNTTAAQVTNTDYVDPLTSGFTVTASAPAALNASGGTYLFLAIA